MKAARFHRTGNPEVLVYEEVLKPTPRAGEVLINIEAVGVTFADITRRRGDDYPDPSPMANGKIVLQPCLKHKPLFFLWRAQGQ